MCLAGWLVLPALAESVPWKKPAYRAVIRSLVEAPDGTLWIGTFGRGTWCLASGSPHLVVHPDGTIPSHRISRLALAGNRLFVATAGEGPLAWNLSSSRWEAIAPAPDGRMRYLHGLWADASGTMVLGSVGSGAALLSGGQWQYLGRAEGLTDDWVNDVVADPDGWWMATSRGLFHLDRRSGRIDRRLFPRDDWEDPDINVLTRIDDRLVLGTTEEGVVIVAPDGPAARVPGLGGAIHALVGPVAGPAGTPPRLWAAGDCGLWLVSLPLRGASEPPRARKVSGPWADVGIPKALTVLSNGDLVIGTMQGCLLRLAGGHSLATATPPAAGRNVASGRPGGTALSTRQSSGGEKTSPDPADLMPTLFARFEDGHLRMITPANARKGKTQSAGQPQTAPPGSRAGGECLPLRGGEE